MGQWNEERDIILAGATARDTDLKYVLTKTPLADDTFFDIPRMRPYYSIKHLSYGTRIYVDYVTSFANCKSPSMPHGCIAASSGTSRTSWGTLLRMSACRTTCRTTSAMSPHRM